MLRRLTLVVLSLAGLGACNEPQATLEPLPDVVAAARPGTPISLTSSEAAPIVSTGIPPAPTGHAKSADSGTADLTFSFVDADIREILHTVLGELLELNYVVDPDVQGTASLETVAPVTRAQALSMLEGVLSQNNAALIKAGPIYRVRSTSSVDASQPMASSTSTGIAVIPLHYTGADRVVKLLTPFISPDSGLAGDANRNVVMVSGSVAARAALVALIQTCDSDLLATQSFALFPVPDGAAAKAAGELEKALQVQEGGALRVVALDRVDAVLVVAHESAGLDAARRLFDLIERGRLATARVWHVYTVHNGSSDDLGRVLRQAYPTAEKPEQGVRVVADRTRNALAIYATGAEYDAITATLERVDIVPLQVRIDASVAEVTLGDTLSYGSQFAVRNQGLAALLTTGATAAISGANPGFTLARMGTSGPQEIVTALADATQVRLLSAPQITVANNVQGSIEVGDSVPYVSGTDTSTLFPDAPTVNSVTYAQTGVLLQVTPRVSADGLVTLDLVQQISEPEVIAGSPQGSPGFSDRRFKGRVVIQDGQTVAVAGLVDDSLSETNAGLPVLKDIPAVGSLVGTQTNTRTRTELLVLITPHVIHDGRDAHALAEDLRHTLRRAALVKSP